MELVGKLGVFVRMSQPADAKIGYNNSPERFRLSSKIMFHGRNIVKRVKKDKYMNWYNSTFYIVKYCTLLKWISILGTKADVDFPLCVTAENLHT